MAKNKKVILRADGGPNIGMGHFVRTLALGEMLQNDFYCIYATRVPTNHQKQEIKNVCHELIELPADDSHFNEFIKYLQGDEIVVLDNYYFNTEYQKRIKNKGCKLVCIDDIYDKHYISDLLINHSPGLNPEYFSVENYTKLLLGLDYTLIRKIFRQTKHSNNSTGNFNNLFITFGGADFYNLTLKYLKGIIHISWINTINVITGEGYNHKNELNSFINRHSGLNKIQHYHNIDPSKLIKVMDSSDIAIAPASTILYELVSQRIPVISGYYINNQKSIYQGFLDLGIILGVGNLNDSSNTIDLVNNLDKDRLSFLISKQENIIDNKSEERIINEFKQL